MFLRAFSNDRNLIVGRERRGNNSRRSIKRNKSTSYASSSSINILSKCRQCHIEFSVSQQILSSSNSFLYKSHRTGKKCPHANLDVDFVWNQSIVNIWSWINSFVLSVQRKWCWGRHTKNNNNICLLICMICPCFSSPMMNYVDFLFQIDSTHRNNDQLNTRRTIFVELTHL